VDLLKFWRTLLAPQPSYRKDPVAFLLWDAEQRLRIASDALPHNQRAPDWGLVGFNVEDACRALLERAALHAGARRDPAAARTELQRIRPFLQAMRDAARACIGMRPTPRTRLLAQTFAPTLLGALLAGETAMARELAAACLSPAVFEEGGAGESGGPHDELAKMLAAALLPDRERFRLLQARFAGDREEYAFFDRYLPYVAMMAAVVAEDARAFEQMRQSHEGTFSDRAQDRDSERGELLDGFGSDGRFVVDMWGLGMLALAQAAGLPVQAQALSVLGGGPQPRS
jgi:hypothetical protein